MDGPARVAGAILSDFSRPESPARPIQAASFAGKAGRITQRTPRRVPFARRLRGIELVMVARPPEIVRGIGVPEHVRSLEHAIARFERGFVQRTTRVPVSFLLVVL